jgi:DNA-binding GntR family transcriptional regulator
MYVHLEIIGQTEHLDAEHLSILDAVERGDAASAGQLTRDHLGSAHDFILTYMLEMQGAASGDGAEPATGRGRPS